MSRISKVIEEYGIDPNGKKVIKLHFECDTISDLPTTAEAATGNIVIALGSDAHIIQDDTKYMIKGDGVWVKQKGEFELSLDAAAIDYDNTTSGMAADNVQDAIDEIDTDIETVGNTVGTQGTAIAGLQTQNTSQQNEIDYAINTGAKNIVINTADASRTLNNVTWTKNDDGSMTANGTSSGVSAVRIVGVQGSSTYANAVPIPRGTYTVSASGFDLTRYRFALGFFADENATRETINIYNEPYTFTVNSDTARYDFSCVIALSGEVMSGETWYPMIRPAVITSSTYEPYAPSNRELYEMILQLQSAAGLRTVSTLRSAAAPKSEIEEEITEDEER